MISGTTSKNMTSQSGRSSGSYDEATGSATMTLTSRSGFEASSSSECATFGPASMSSRTQSGSSGAMGTISRGMSKRSGSHVVRDVDAANAAELDGAAQASDAVRGADGAVVDRSQGSI